MLRLTALLRLRGAALLLPQLQQGWRWQAYLLLQQACSATGLPSGSTAAAAASNAAGRSRRCALLLLCKLLRTGAVLLHARALIYVLSNTACLRFYYIDVPQDHLIRLVAVPALPRPRQSSTRQTSPSCRTCTAPALASRASFSLLLSSIFCMRFYCLEADRPRSVVCSAPRCFLGFYTVFPSSNRFAVGACLTVCVGAPLGPPSCVCCLCVSCVGALLCGPLLCGSVPVWVGLSGVPFLAAYVCVRYGRRCGLRCVTWHCGLCVSRCVTRSHCDHDGPSGPTILDS